MNFTSNAPTIRKYGTTQERRIVSNLVFAGRRGTVTTRAPTAIAEASRVAVTLLDKIRMDAGTAMPMTR